MIDFIEATRFADGTAAAPVAGTNLVLFTAPPKGAYKIRVAYRITGANEAAAQNIQLNGNGATLLDLPTAGQPDEVYEFDRVDLNGSNNLSLTVAANATLSTVYTGFIAITRIEP